MASGIVNTILFYPHEIERYRNTIASPTDNTIVLEMPAYDMRSVHIRTILQAKPDDALSAGIINESMGRLVLTDISPTTIHAEYQIITNTVTPIHSTVIMLLAHPRPPVMERLLRDLTTMGVAHIIVYAAELSEKSYLNASLWKKTDTIVLSGAMQGNTNRIPTLYTCVGIENALSYASTITTSCSKDDTNTPLHSFVFDHHAPTRYSDVLYTIAASHKAQDCMPYMICSIGPERGYTEYEYTMLQQHQLLPVAFHNTVLRTETAALLAVGMWNSITTFM